MFNKQNKLTKFIICTLVICFCSNMVLSNTQNQQDDGFFEEQVENNKELLTNLNDDLNELEQVLENPNLSSQDSESTQNSNDERPDPQGEISQDDFLNNMTDEEKQQYIEQHRMRMTLCMVYSQLSFTKHIEDFKKIVEKRQNTEFNEKAVAKKVISGVIINCLVHMTNDDSDKFQAKLQNKDYDISEFPHLNDFDYKSFEDDRTELAMSDDENEAYKTLEEFEKKSQEERKKHEAEEKSKKSSSSSSNSKKNSGSQNNENKKDSKNTGANSGVTMFGFDMSKISSPWYLVIAFGAIYILFYIGLKKTYADAKSKQPVSRKDKRNNKANETKSKKN